ncbi:hypothetical protein [Flavobacterium daemonense]|uniref:hypothetical protein n=1 Tax=Flavobacterium daemonense TaxID=1393049 RepID=UPI001FE6DAA5|nr:hypothetical protein [Flavobacterium daemonense]
MITISQLKNKPALQTIMIMMIFLCTHVHAQDKSTEDNFINQNLHSALQIRNSHLWRGIEVAAGLTYTGNIYLEYDHFYGGFWAGGTADGSYKEFNNYAGFKAGKFSAELWDIYNFSPKATYNNKEFFNYNASETGRFFDLRTYYTVSKQFPLVLSWNTVIFGRDRNLANTENRYSTFVSAEYPFLKSDKWSISGRAGYSFALNNSENETSNFFASKAGVNEVSLIFSRKTKILDYKLPLGLWAMWNPVDNHAFLQFSAEVYSF